MLTGSPSGILETLCEAFHSVAKSQVPPCHLTHGVLSTIAHGRFKAYPVVELHSVGCSTLHKRIVLLVSRCPAVKQFKN